MSVMKCFNTRGPPPTIYRSRVCASRLLCHGPSATQARVEETTKETSLRNCNSIQQCISHATLSMIK